MLQNNRYDYIIAPKPCLQYYFTHLKLGAADFFWPNLGSPLDQKLDDQNPIVAGVLIFLDLVLDIIR